jgi:hypothetical protein
MKATISENNGFRHIVELTPMTYPAGHTQLKFTTEWDHARRDGSEQVQFEIFLSQQELANFKDML